MFDFQKSFDDRPSVLNPQNLNLNVKIRRTLAARRCPACRPSRRRKWSTAAGRTEGEKSFFVCASSVASTVLNSMHSWRILYRYVGKNAWLCMYCCYSMKPKKHIFGRFWAALDPRAENPEARPAGPPQEDEVSPCWQLKNDFGIIVRIWILSSWWELRPLCVVNSGPSLYFILISC